LTPGRSASQPEYLVIGQVLAPRGLKGEVRVAIITDFPDRFALLDHVYLGPEHILFKLERFRRHKQWALLKFAGLDTRDSVEKLRGLSVEIPIAQAMPLGQDEYYEHQLIGLEVWSTDQRLLGRVTEIIFTGSNDVRAADTRPEGYRARDQPGKRAHDRPTGGGIIEAGWDSRLASPLFDGTRPMTEKKYWLGFNIVPRIGPVRFRALLEHFGNLETAWHAESAQLSAAGLDRRALANLLAMRGRLSLDEEWDKVARLGAHILTWEDQAYPRLLREIDDSPPVLYVKGELVTTDEWAVAVVGTRRATSYGRDAALQLAGDLARNNITVVSGLARGIDSVAHKAALDAGGRTIAVLGCGVDIIYPAENRGLAKAICESGALISEYPLGTKPEARNFPPRNRIISGLSLGTVVVEGGERSGAMISARYALEQGREVFAVPGNIGRRNSRGANKLIRDSGAKLILSVEDIMVELNLTMVTQHAAVREIIPENQTEALLLRHLYTEPVHVDEIQRQVNLPVSEVSSALALMELKGMVRQVGGMNYVLAHESSIHYVID